MLNCSAMSNSWDPMDCSPLGSSVHGILQARIMEWVAKPFSRASSQPRDWIWVSCMKVNYLPSDPPRKSQTPEKTPPTLLSRDQVANIRWIIKKGRKFQKDVYFCFIDYAKAFDCVDHNKLWKILKEMVIPATLPASWEICMQVKKQQLEPEMELDWFQRDWFQIGKGVRQGYILSPCLFNFYAEYIMRNAGLDEAQAGIKIARILITSDAQMTPLLWSKVKRN